MLAPCSCMETHDRRRIVLTGGPGAGKTAFLGLVRQSFCSHVRILPESAGVLFGGGFPREPGADALRAVQRAIYYVQRELEAVADTHDAAVVLCDRGTVDGAAYWPGPSDLFSAVGTTPQVELARYDAVIHLRTPTAADGYNHQNPLRTESAEAAADIDDRIMAAWEGHPRRWIVQAGPTFLVKADNALGILRGELPECCVQHELGRVTADRNG